MPSDPNKEKRIDSLIKYLASSLSNSSPETRRAFIEFATETMAKIQADRFAGERQQNFYGRDSLMMQAPPGSYPYSAFNPMVASTFNDGNLGYQTSSLSGFGTPSAFRYTGHSNSNGFNFSSSLSSSVTGLSPNESNVSPATLEGSENNVKDIDKDSN